PIAGAGVTFTSAATDSDGTIVSYSWDLDGDGVFGDGSAAATGATVTHTFPAGAWTVTLTVDEAPIPPATAPAAATTTVSRAITANTRPVARFTWTPPFPIAGAGVTFTSGSTDGDGTIVGYSWDLDGDGAMDTSSGTTPTLQHAFSKGTQYLTVRVTDDRGAKAYANAAVNVR
ncbi:MAG TPA: PKD domain-containing protein, partial [Thermoleophilaceae bacterium]|nr:PKD domain-containing protein [Thermoleophilaceae bacterium]